MFKNLMSLPMMAVMSVALFAAPAHSKVYKNIAVKKYKASLDLSKFTGMTFLSFMQTQVYPALNKQAATDFSEEYIDAVAGGEGVEVRLGKDVSTFHVKYEAYGEDKAERSGRSFAAVGKGAKIPYVADASYKHYLTTLGELVKGDKTELRNFYTAIIQILTNSDSSGIDNLEDKTKQIIADFVAVYIAEQYRHMMSGTGKGDLGKTHNWDDAHLQVTLLAAFHGGQKTPGMYYEKKFTSMVFNQLNRISATDDACVYKDSRDPVRDTLKKRVMNLTDYWQFNGECERSGVNITRKDFELMGTAISEWNAVKNPQIAGPLKLILGAKSANVYAGIAGLFVNNKTAKKFTRTEAAKFTDAIVDYIMQGNTDAVKITTALKPARQ